MLDGATIRALSRRAARRSAQERLVPTIIWPGDAEDLGGLKIPFIGDRCPRGWKRVRLDEGFEPGRRGVYLGDNRGYGAYFVDSSGLGGTGEAALAIGEFAERLKVGYGYAVVEAGEFQVKVGVYQKIAA